MNLENSFDLFLYVAMLFDLAFKMHCTNKIKHQMPKWQRYRINNSLLKKYIYIIITAINIGYIGYRLYNIVINQNYNFNNFALILPVVMYYVIFDYLISGIYFNQRSIYYKQEFMYYSDFKYSYRRQENNYFIYSIHYQNDKNGSRDFEIKIKDEPQAYALLSSIPFKELNE